MCIDIKRTKIYKNDRFFAFSLTLRGFSTGKMKADNDWKSRLGVVFSTNPDFQYSSEEAEEERATLEPAKQQLRVGIDRRNRGGKQVTLISGFIGTEDDLVELGRTLKTKCGVGGSAKDGEIIIQGDFRDKVVQILQTLGYTRTKRSN